VAEVLLIIAVLLLPVLAGAIARLAGRPWWWGAVLAVVVILVAAIAPEPEAGESRLVAGDLVFLLLVALIAAGLAWLGAWLAGRFAQRA
jgi:4-hydroxybenzoate polyprenyltransferase